MSRKIKTFIVVLVAVVCMGTASAFALTNYWSRQPLNVDSNIWNAYQEEINDIKIADGKLSLNDAIPMYTEKELLFATEGVFDLGRDAGVYANLNYRPNSTGAILTAYPTKAIREQDNNTTYFIYDTDTGYRLYLFFKADGEALYLQGYPIILRKLLSYDDFKKIKVGDSISAVERIDAVASLYKKQITEVWNLNYEGAKSNAEHGMPCVSVHYLKDGLLVFKYDMLENSELVISHIDYKADFILADVLDENVCYKINEVDLPTKND